MSRAEAGEAAHDEQGEEGDCNVQLMRHVMSLSLSWPACPGHPD